MERTEESPAVAEGGSNNNPSLPKNKPGVRRRDSQRQRREGTSSPPASNTPSSLSPDLNPTVNEGTHSGRRSRAPKPYLPNPAVEALLPPKERAQIQSHSKTRAGSESRARPAKGPETSGAGTEPVLVIKSTPSPRAMSMSRSASGSLPSTKASVSKQAISRQGSRATVGSSLAAVVIAQQVQGGTGPGRASSVRSMAASANNKQGQPPARTLVTMSHRAGFAPGVSVAYKAIVEKAIKDRKVFAIGGVYPAIRNALKKRGWIEKSLNTTIPNCMKAIIQTSLTREVADTKPMEDESEQAYCQRVLTNYPPDFIWVIRRDNIAWNQLDRNQQINRYPKAHFTTKVGIAQCVQSMQWFSEAGVADTFFPRCYRLCIDEEKQAFLDDYRLTACLGLLRWVITNYEREGERGIFDPSSKVSCLSVDFAVRQINNYVRMRRHEDIDWLMPPAFMLQHWDVFINQYYSVVLMRMKLGPKDSLDGARAKYDIAKKALQRITPYWPQLYVDGILNIWICKPGARSRGKGITIMNHIESIMDLTAQPNFRESNWVVQKYIEKPLLIYKTKFDMRQWFVVTDWAPLTIWFAKESYVRFCTKPFTLEDFHESVHLCNNAIQCKYQNANERDSALPDENMWDCYTFQAYLKTIGKMDLWDKVIYPGMKQGIIGVMLASQEGVEIKKNCFELYGADFMLTEDYRPWLIEINSCPCMAASTSVTARMCAQCLEDTIKVVIDRKEDKTADTGMFELIYRQTIQSLNSMQYAGIDLLLQGTKLSKDVDWPGIMTKYSAKRGPSPQSQYARNTPAPTLSHGLTFVDLVQKLRLNALTFPSPLGPDDQKKAITSSTSPPPAAGNGSSLGKNSAAPAGPPLSVKKITPDIIFNGAGYTVKSNDFGTYSPLYSQISNKAQLYNTSFGKGNGSKDTPFSLLLNHGQPTAVTMADLIREQEDTARETALDLLAKRSARKSKPTTTAFPIGYTSTGVSKKRSSSRNRNGRSGSRNGSRDERRGSGHSATAAAAGSHYGKASWKNVYYYNKKNGPPSLSSPIPEDPNPNESLTLLPPSCCPSPCPPAQCPAEPERCGSGHSSTGHESEPQPPLGPPTTNTAHPDERLTDYKPPPPLPPSLLLTKKVRPKTIERNINTSTDKPASPFPNSESDLANSLLGSDLNIYEENNFDPMTSCNPHPFPSSVSSSGSSDSKLSQVQHCYRMALEHPNHQFQQLLLSRKASLTLPLKTINLPPT